ncbi:hypothetical protein HBA55_36030 [Pseudomaricurvus alkylphenolicus]|jgi:hypothetical protein|uniref:hypothetical protein n=1 Tax=Pseudomaricurvus alkylphenolicus TaxID=1306991 RepID=UPI0014206ED9|nr:hypothetical protein [Pseudomaricurvus alkylphenolicus]NIB45044.1 hypothetical protein [Pseudomaricurvus alkylphenolicus]
MTKNTDIQRLCGECWLNGDDDSPICRDPQAHLEHPLQVKKSERQEMQLSLLDD